MVEADLKKIAARIIGTAKEFCHSKSVFIYSFIILFWDFNLFSWIIKCFKYSFSYLFKFFNSIIGDERIWIMMSNAKRWQLSYKLFGNIKSQYYGYLLYQLPCLYNADMIRLIMCWSQNFIIEQFNGFKKLKNNNDNNKWSFSFVFFFMHILIKLNNLRLGIWPGGKDLWKIY